MTDVVVWAEWCWTCQHCFATTKGYDSQEATADDIANHKCEDYRS